MAAAAAAVRTVRQTSVGHNSLVNFYVAESAATAAAAWCRQAASAAGVAVAVNEGGRRRRSGGGVSGGGAVRGRAAAERLACRRPGLSLRPEPPTDDVTCQSSVTSLHPRV